IRMSKLIKDVLRYSQANRRADLIKKVDLNATLKDVIEDFELLMEEKNVVINTEVLPTIEGIPMQFQQLFSNLIGNSIKFTEHSPIINISAKELSSFQVSEYQALTKSKKYVELIVTDNGPGFDEQYKDRIFKLFQRLSDKKYGTGIGLALCKKIVENHQGCIEVKSNVNQGTSFHIILPVFQ